MALESPFEYLDLAAGESLRFRVVAWELGESFIRPRDAPDGKTVPTLRVHVRPQDKPSFPPYYDFTSARAIAQLRPQLQRPDVAGLTFRVTAAGFGLKRTYTVDVDPGAAALAR